MLYVANLPVTQVNTNQIIRVMKILLTIRHSFCCFLILMIYTIIIELKTASL